jgi:prepilin-type N-terminal cleavage/methylation domain-containing protein
MGKRGFTLVELIIVIGIIALLAASLIVAVSGFSGHAREEATKGLLDRIRLAMDEYKKDFGDYPPDGFDKEEYDNNDSIMYGSQTLVYYLAWRTGEKGAVKIELKKRERRPGDDEDRMVPAHGNKPYLVLDDSELGPGFHPDILDAWGLPLHYDYNIGEKSAFQDSPQGVYHSREAPPHKETDPRRKGMPSNTYDVWSHGNDGANDTAAADDDILLK